MFHDRSHRPPAGLRSGSLARLGRRVFIVAALVGVTLLGNLRLQASEVRRPLSAPVTTATDARVFAHAQALSESLASMSGVNTEAARYDGAAPAATPVLPADTADADSPPDDANDAAHVVPAIYAWDPDVRFVYFRHVSKWM
jgi:hypothetical protein